MSQKIEYRTSLDVRATDETDGYEGHAASWWSVDSYGTAFAPGAFKRSIRQRPVEKIPVLWNHNPDHPMGKHVAIREDKSGLYVNVGIADDGAEGSVFLKRLRFGVPFGLSFGFATLKDRSAEDDDPIDLTTAPEWLGRGKEARKNVRVITEVKLWETSPVTFASNENSDIDAIRDARFEQQAEYLTSLLEDLRSGEFSPNDSRRSLLQNLVDAFAALPAPAPDPNEGTTPRSDESARRLTQRDIELAIALGQSQGWLTGA